MDRKKITLIALVIVVIAAVAGIYYFSTSTGKQLTLNTRAEVIQGEGNMGPLSVEKQTEFIKKADGSFVDLQGNSRDNADAYGYGLKLTIKNKQAFPVKMVYDANTDFCRGTNNNGKLHQKGNTYYCNMGQDGELPDSAENEAREHNVSMDFAANETKVVTIYRDSDYAANCGSYQVDFALKDVFKDGQPMGASRECTDTPGCFPSIIQTSKACPDKPTATPIPPTAQPNSSPTPAPVSCGGSKCNPALGTSACTTGHQCIQANNGEYYCSLPTTVDACKANPSAASCCAEPTKVQANTPPSLTVEGPKDACYEKANVYTVSGSKGSSSEALSFQLYVVKKDHSDFDAAECPSATVDGPYCQLASKPTPDFTADANGLPVGDYELFTQVVNPAGTVVCSNNTIEANPTKCSNACL